MNQNQKELLNAMRAVKRLLDGSQPKDIPGAIMVLNYAISLAEGNPVSAPKYYCDDPDDCTYSDCPTAFCDRKAWEAFELATTGCFNQDTK